MNFLNLQHLGEVDEVQQLKKEHFDRRANDVLAGTSGGVFGGGFVPNIGPPSKKLETGKEMKDVETLAEHDLDFKKHIRKLYLFADP